MIVITVIIEEASFLPDSNDSNNSNNGSDNDNDGSNNNKTNNKRAPSATCSVACATTATRLSDWSSKGFFSRTGIVKDSSLGLE